MSNCAGAASTETGHHSCFWAARSAVGFTFCHPTFVCEINFEGKGTCVQQRRNTQKTFSKGHQTPQKKAVLLKNCFAHLNSKIDNSIDCQKSFRRFRSPPRRIICLRRIFDFLSCGQDDPRRSRTERS